MPVPTLPARYYLAHFFELIDFLEAHYQPLLEEGHRAFINDFRRLSEEAQCTYVRMVNRKGRVFRISRFKKYTEIDNPSGAIQELKENGFASELKASLRLDLLKTLTKTELRKWFSNCGLIASSGLSKEDFVLVGKENIENLELSQLPQRDDLIVQDRFQELDYLLFLYFGKIQKTLSLYTLRDLGIRTTNERHSFQARFEDLGQARAEHFFSQDIEGDDDIERLLNKCMEYKKLRLSSRKLKDQMLLKIAEISGKDQDDVRIRALKECRTPPAREKLIRTLYRKSLKDEVRALLEEIISEPWSDEELLFAEDFLRRKFHREKTGLLTKALADSREITLSDYYLKRPETGVKEHYLELGHAVHFTENHIWTGLFGLLFWDELFVSEKAAIFNPFERSPLDLANNCFYEKHKIQIENKLKSLGDLKAIRLELLKTVSQHYGKLNDIFSWNQELVPLVLEFLKGSDGKDPAHVLRKMCQRYDLYHSGYPDLMVIRNGNAGFIEVKAEGDQLRSKQLTKIRLLREAGYDVEVLRVKWKADPSQTYVVVDVETTGGSPKFHRVIEIGAVKVQNGKVIDEFQTLINPGRSISKHITQITGITNEMVVDAPLFSEIADRFMEFTDKSVFVAHNVRFDYGFIQQEYQRLDKSFVRPQMCTCSGMRKAFPGISSYSLKNLTEYFGIPLREHHRAMCDAKAATELLFMINGHR